MFSHFIQFPPTTNASENQFQSINMRLKKSHNIIVSLCKAYLTAEEVIVLSDLGVDVLSVVHISEIPLNSEDGTIEGNIWILQSPWHVFFSLQQIPLIFLSKTWKKHW